VKAGLGGVFREGEAEGRDDQIVRAELEVDLAEADHPLGRVALDLPPAIEATLEQLSEVGGGDLGDEGQGLGAFAGGPGGLLEVMIEDGQGVRGVVQLDTEGALRVLDAGGRHVRGRGRIHRRGQLSRRKALATEVLG
jgi:hypothetical protein